MRTLGVATIAAIAITLGTGCKLVGNQVTYETCSASSDCADAQDTCLSITAAATRNSCTRQCSTDANCPRGGHCLSFNGSFVCTQPCSLGTPNVCEIGWGCTDNFGGGAFAPSCLPGVSAAAGIPIYDECVSASDPCDSPSGCAFISVDGATRGICTTTCDRFANNCPFDRRSVQGECLSFDGGTVFTCFERCTSIADCAVGFACKNSASGGLSFPPICLPM